MTDERIERLARDAFIAFIAYNAIPLGPAHDAGLDAGSARRWGEAWDRDAEGERWAKAAWRRVAHALTAGRRERGR